MWQGKVSYPRTWGSFGQSPSQLVSLDMKMYPAARAGSLLGRGCGGFDRCPPAPSSLCSRASGPVLCSIGLHRE